MPYTGPGDIVSGARAWYGLRAYSAAVAATGTQKAIRVIRASDSAQQDILILTNGDLDTASAVSFGASTTLKVVTFYDQSGNGNDITNATDSNRPTLSFSVFNSTYPALHFSSNQWLQGTIASTTRPVSYSAIAQYDTSGTGVLISINTSGGNEPDLVRTSANAMNVWEAAQINTPLADNTIGTINAIANDGSSSIRVNGTTASGNTGSAGSASTGIAIGAEPTAGHGNKLAGYIFEVGMWPSAISSGDQNSLDSNQTTYINTITYSISNAIKVQTQIDAFLQTFSNALAGATISIQSSFSSHITADNRLSGNVESKSSISAGLTNLIPLFGSINVKSQIRSITTTIHLLSSAIEIQTKLLTNPSTVDLPISGTPKSRTFTNADPLWVAVEIDLYNSIIADTETLRLCNKGTVTRTVSSVFYNYMPRLQVPFIIGSNLPANFYQNAPRGQPNGGTISFAVDPDITQYFQQSVYHWLGRTFRVYEGRTFDLDNADVDADLEIVYTGHVVNLKIDISSKPTATIQTTDVSGDLDKSLIDDFFPADHAITALRGLPRPEVLGRVIEIEPVLIDQDNLVYLVSRSPLDDITSVELGGVELRRVGTSTLFTRYVISGATYTNLGGTYLGFYMDSGDVGWWTGVGGASVVIGTTVPVASGGRQLYTIVQQFGPSYIGALLQSEIDDFWLPSGARVYPYVSGSTPPPPFQGPTVDPILGTPSQGEYYADLTAGTIQLGAVTSGADLRVNAQARGYLQYNMTAFISDVCGRRGVAVNPSYMDQLRTNLPGPIGYFTGTSPVNCLNLLDEVTQGSLVWWSFDVRGEVIADFMDSADFYRPDFLFNNENPQTPLDYGLIAPFSNVIDPIVKEVEKLDVSQFLARIWRARVEYAKNWSPLSQAGQGITEDEAALKKSVGPIADYGTSPFIQVLSPQQGIAIQKVEPRADDITLKSFVLTNYDAHVIRHRLVTRVSGDFNKVILDCNVWMKASKIELFKVVALVWVDDNLRTRSIYSGKFRILSCIRSVGGDPQQLQLWGYLNCMSQPRTSLTDVIAISTFPTVLYFSFTFSLYTTSRVLEFVGIVSVSMSDSSVFEGTFSFDSPFEDDNGLVEIDTQVPDTSYVYLRLTRDLTDDDTGNHVITMTATHTNGTSTTTSLVFLVSGPVGTPGVPIAISFSPSRVTLYDNALAGSFVARAIVTMSDNSTFTGDIESDNDLFAIDGLNIVLARDLTPDDDSSLSVTISVVDMPMIFARLI